MVAHSYVAAPAVLLGLGLGACSRSTTPTPAIDGLVEPNAAVLDVVDGDTLLVDIDGHEEPVRLIGIDTPESVAPNRPVECYGNEASERLKMLIPPDTPVRLERDVEARDMYDRVLAYVYRAADGLHVNLDQVERGYAEAMPYPPNTALQSGFATAEQEARANDAGLWGTCGGPDVPVDPPPTDDD